MSSDEHFCQYITKWPATQDDTTEHCGLPATIKDSYEGIYGWVTKWLCAKHYDMIEASVRAYNAGVKAAKLDRIK